MLNTRSLEEKQKLRQDLQVATENSIKEIESLITERNKLLDRELETRSQALNQLINELGGTDHEIEQMIETAMDLQSDDEHWNF
ncbi:unnamed protein product [Rotaria sp. Silwood2]|nr:unnamed protein product [Rotaria sp. Silwood2]CAF3142521.1 unnamed protein product [Rotaria sp. Silwood2]CAF3332805.1 unnamed protein product [Rotaria sp. Silwood2]CAF3418537.1 unnamed protein product [Rotaria sp. Silwood2]CAF4372599.1 unnamed protein product [Rotaria sp. Silwood2]